MPRDTTPHLILVALLGTAIWGSWFYALYRGITLQQPPGRKFWTWLATLGALLAGATVLVIRHEIM
jgi:hypothetical protein